MKRKHINKPGTVVWVRARPNNHRVSSDSSEVSPRRGYYHTIGAYGAACKRRLAVVVGPGLARQSVKVQFIDQSGRATVQLYIEHTDCIVAEVLKGK